MDSVFNKPYPFVGPPKYYLRQEYFPLSQSLNRKNGFMVVKTRENFLNDQIGRSRSFTDISSVDKFYQNLHAPSLENAKPFVPKFVELDKKVLKFTAYYVEPVYESLKEIHRIRYVDVYYYLLEETMSVVEPKIDNSGLVQGKVFIRQKVPCYYDQSKCLNWRDLNIGLDIEMFGRIYTLTDCDGFTKEFCQNQGVRINEKQFGPTDPYLFTLQTSNLSDDKVKQRVSREKNARNEILTFFAVWDDKFGYDYSRIWRRLFSINFFRFDETFTIKQTTKTYDGLTPTMLNRQKLKKPKGAEGPPQWYTEKDLHIGKWILVNGRPMLVYDCDKSTRNLLNISTDPIDLTAFPPGHLPQVEFEQSGPSETKNITLFSATLDNPPNYLSSISNYIIQFELDSNSITIWERKDKLDNFKGRMFIGRSPTMLL